MEGAEATTVLAASAPSGQLAIPGYQICRALGAGGMGEVYRTVQTSTGREVALKVMAVGTNWSATGEHLFKREIRLAATLEHPNIARVYDAGSTDGKWYYSMQLVDGVHLDRYVNAHAKSPEAILRLMVCICEAVGFAHQHGIVHRDLKPSNILVTGDGTPFLVDFGLAKCLEETETRPSVTGNVVTGTVGFISPELIDGHKKELSPAADVYALGVILYRLLTGAMPYDETGGPMVVLKRISEGDIIPLRQRKADLDPRLGEIIYKALALKPHHRPHTALDLARELTAYLESTGARNDDAPAATTRKRAHRTDQATAPAPAMLLAMVGGGVLLVGIFAGILYATSGGKDILAAVHAWPLGWRLGPWLLIVALLPWLTSGLIVRIREQRSNVASAGLLAGYTLTDVLLALPLGLFSSALLAALLLVACIGYNFWVCETISARK
jgi:predicted Ser/Thr protein kinase